ncbi:MAG TPA: alpha/beta hydrolase [Nocardioides sp.]|nr:alpha/beta hydrolase [Nocardioides sp.]
MKTHDGLELAVSPRGPDDAPVTVVLAHCWTADTEDWQYQVRDLLDRFGHDVRILTWDHRGHGASDPAPLPSCTIENLGRDMADVIDRYAGSGRLVIAGHSIGGMATMALAEQRPDILGRTDGVLFASTSCGDLGQVTLGLPEAGRWVKAQIPRVLAARARLLSRRVRRRNPWIESQVVHRFLFGQPMRLRDCGLVIDQLISCPPATMEGFYRDFMSHDRRAALARFDGIPTRVLVGDHDVLTPVDHARRLAAGIASARLMIAPGAGHMLPLERDRLVSDELVELVTTSLEAARDRGAVTEPA